MKNPVTDPGLRWPLLAAENGFMTIEQAKRLITAHPASRPDEKSKALALLDALPLAQGRDMHRPRKAAR